VNNLTYQKFFTVEKGDVVVDAGAHVGCFTRLASKKANKVVAIEPEPVNLFRLKSNLRRWKANNVIVVEKGLWNSVSTISLHLRENYSVGHSLFNSSLSESKVNVDVDTLDNILAELNISSVDFLKMNIEGAELEALQGAKETLKKTSKVVVEAHHSRDGEKTAPRVAKALRNNGFLVHVGEQSFVYGVRAQTRTPLYFSDTLLLP